MFGFFGKDSSKAKAKPARPVRQKGNGDELGIFSPFNVDPEVGPEISDDEGLEDELNALAGVSKLKMKPKVRGKPVVNPADLDRMVAESMKDLDDDDEDDEEDPDLESELMNLESGSVSEEDLGGAESPDEAEPAKAPPPKQNPSVLAQTLSERLTMYQTAEANAKAGGEAARVKRLQRGMKTLQDQIVGLRKGKAVDESEIPPPVATGAKKLEPSPDVPETVAAPPVPFRVAPPPPVIISDSAESDVVELLRTRKEAYKQAAVVAKQTGDTESALKYVRIVKQFDPVIAAAESGQPVDLSTIPPVPTSGVETRIDSPYDASPVVSDAIQGKQVPAEEPAQLAIPTPRTALEALEQRLEKYKAVEKQAQDEGNSSKARRFSRIVKQYQSAIKDHKAGRAVEYAELPCPPGYPPIPGTAQPPPARELSPVPPSMLSAGEPTVRGPSPFMRGPSPVTAVTGQITAVPASVEEPAVDMFRPPPQPATVHEALLQRLDKYKSIEKQASDEGNQRKAKMYGRIVKQYEDAVRAHSKGRAVDFSELPTPPGFGPIPGFTPPSDDAPVLAATAEPAQRVSPQPKRQPEAQLPVSAKKPAPSLQQKQLEVLVERQKLFKGAAMEAKTRGELNQAKEFLKISKGFDPLIEASKGGLPVDMKTIPIPPQQQAALESTVEDGFEKVSSDDCLAPVDLSADTALSLKDVYRQLEIDFLTQMKECLRNRDHFRASGDAASANRMEQLAQEAKRDLDRLRVYKMRGDPVPRYKYESKTFSIVRCNTELDDNVLEMFIVRGISYVVPNPKEVDTYVKFEFPWPSETPVKHKTTVLKDTNNPEYNQSFMIPINRQSRAFQRVLKKTIKFEVFSKGSFFSGDKEIGKGGMKIQDLETKCEVHEIFDILDGRKPAGKLEVKARLRHPVLAKQVETVNQKWIVLVD